MKKSNLNKIILKIAQLPSNYLEPLSGASTTKLEMLVGKILTLINDKNKSGVIYVEGTCQPIFEVIHTNQGATKVWGIDFAEYFSSIVKTQSEYEVICKRFVFIYNVGLEAAINTTFSSKLLKNLLKKLANKNCLVFIESDIPYQKFQMQYDVIIPTKISIPLKKGVELL